MVATSLCILRGSLGLILEQTEATTGRFVFSALSRRVSLSLTYFIFFIPLKQFCLLCYLLCVHMRQAGEAVAWLHYQRCIQENGPDKERPGGSFGASVCQFQDQCKRSIRSRRPGVWGCETFLFFFSSSVACPCRKATIEQGTRFQR